MGDNPDQDRPDPADGGEGRSPRELNLDLAAAGVDCAGYTDSAPQAVATGPDGQGRCEIGDEVVYLYSFDDPDDQATFVDDGGLFDCTFASAFAGGATIPFAAGDGWVIRPQTAQQARSIADALGGDVDAVVCEIPSE